MPNRFDALIPFTLRFFCLLRRLKPGLLRKLRASRDTFPHQTRIAYVLQGAAMVRVCYSVPSREYENAAFLLDGCRMLLVDCYRSVEPEEDFPTPEHFVKFFSSDSFDTYLEALAQSNAWKIQPWKNLDSVKEVIKEEEIDGTITGLEETNYDDYDSPETSADDSEDYDTSKRKRSATSTVGELVDQDEADRTTKFRRRRNHIHASVRDETTEHQSWAATKRRSTRSIRGSGSNRGRKKSKAQIPTTVYVVAFLLV
ncbi:hypothetical protein EV421DRAFT_667112 [Armillaria borealis]|uniref:Uncharacterized protein n=1 Tax=Armillaria borealis TaxID=47425 RepID=A0AA39K4K0_9AGAR|nr:hypothetical protein EV421DRAFT_667112 [Armillaria borealis]